MSARLASNIAIVLIGLLATAATIAGALASTPSFATFGLDLAWSSDSSGARTVEVRSVLPGSAAASAGIVVGDRIVAFGSLDDRIALMVQSNIHTGYYLAPGQTATFTIARRRSTIVERLSAGEIRSSRPQWLILLRTVVYVIGALLAIMLVLWRPEAITWGFALFVIFAQQPNIPYLELLGRVGTPLEFLAFSFAAVPCTIAAGSLGLLAFGARFPERVPDVGYRNIERAVQIAVALVVVAFAQWYFGQMFGQPTFERWQLVDAINYLPELTAIGLLGRTLLNSSGEKRVRLAWATVGPSLGTLLTLVDIRLVASGAPYIYGVGFGLLSSIAPFSMVYAILRHRVIDIGMALNQSVADAVVRSEPLGVKLDRRDLVRRVALLLSTDLLLPNLYAQLAALLARFVDASAVLVIRGNATRATLDFNFENGVGARPDDIEIPAESVAGRVLQTGESTLLSHATDWPDARRVSVHGRATIDSESAIFVPVKFAGATLGVISVQSEAPDAYQLEDMQLIEACALYLGARIYDDEFARETAPAAGYDALTHLPGRALFDEALAREWSRTSPLSVLLVELDLFSAFNASYGHVAADVCLREVAATISATIEGGSNLVSRYGTETFVALLPSVHASDAAKLAERVRESIASCAIPHEGSTLGHLSASVGFATAVTSVYDDPQSVMALTTLQLQAAKERGGNRVFGEGYESDAEAARRVGTAIATLPILSAPFVGRVEALARLAVEIENHRLVTLTGVRGIGKTRLALEFAKRNDERYPDGVWCVDLSELTDATRLAQTIAYGLFPSLEVEADNERLTELLADRSLLLILDDCTSILNACARLADTILSGTTGVRIIATAQAKLGIDGEIAHPVRGLDESDALELFLARRTARTSAAQNAVQIVAALEGSPSMIEVAAALPEADEATDGTAEPLIERAIRLMSPDERDVVQRVSAMSDGWSLARASAACADAARSVDTVEQVLRGLIARGLTTDFELGGQPRHRLNQGIRENAHRELQIAGESDASQHHLRYFSGYARDAMARKGLMSFQRWSELLAADLSDYRQALCCAFSSPTRNASAVDILRALRGMLLPLASSYDLASPLREAVRRDDLNDLERGTFWAALAELEHLRSPQDSLRAARHALDFLQLCDAPDDAAYATWRLASAQLSARGAIEERFEATLTASLSTAQGSNDTRVTVGLLRCLARLHSDRGQHDEARQFLRDAAYRTDPTDAASLAELLGSSALEEFRRGNLDGALAMWRQAAALDEEHRPAAAALCFVSVGRCELARGDLIAARIALRKGLVSLKSVGGTFGIAYSFDYLTQLAQQAGDNNRAARIAGFASAMYERGAARPISEEPQYYLLLDQLRGALGQRTFDDEYNRGHFLTLEEAMLEAKAA